MNYKP